MSTSAKKKKKSKPGKKAPAKKTKAKVTKVKKVAKAPAAAKPKKVAKPKVEKVAKPKVEKVEKAERKEAPQKPVVKAERVELGPAPSAVIAARHLDSIRGRPGRGFSFSELTSAGVEFNLARREGLSVDVRRRSSVEGNVEALKQWLKTAVASKPAREPVAMAAVSKKK
jgi:ribosomal protein L13E